MSTHKNFDKLCVAAIAIALVLTILLMNGAALGIQSVTRSLGYEDRLFDTASVHTIDIVMDDWDGFLDTAQSEEYTLCSVVIDGKAVKNVGIRGKGNTSLSSVASMDSDRYSFKLEFDHYDSTQSYYGLDKLCLNNIIQDNTYMKDYLVYQMMARFGVAAPLCSYAWITVNGEDWGLYLAVEGVEDGFLARNYGGTGQLYKPDSMSMGGGFALDEDTVRQAFADLGLDESLLEGVDFADLTIESIQSILSGLSQEELQGLMQAVMGGDIQLPDMGDMGSFGGMGSSDVKLQYIDDDPASYSNIFDSAKTDITDADKARLIASLKQLSAYENVDEVVDVESVLRYFVVHNFVVNGDSYTGSMIHNYYLYEKDGQLAMIPWDYNLAFGTFQGGSATSAVNDDIDEVLSDRPMQAWIFSDETYSQRYYDLYAQLLEEVDVQAIIDEAQPLIAPYVERDPTAFCTYAEFTTGVEALKDFCALRSESVERQLSGSTEAVDVGSLNLSDMGTMNNGMGGGDRGGFDFTAVMGGQSQPAGADTPPSADGDTVSPPTLPDGMQMSEGGQMPDGAQMPEGMQLPDGVQQPDGMQLPSGSTEQPEKSQQPLGQQTAQGGQRPDAQPTGDIQRPEGAQMPGSGGSMPGGQSGGGGSTALLLTASLLVLSVGLLTARLYQRRR